ncbi:hypothetical protein LTR85_011376 [Meristemomyces frigidus]|nr:hypothetical protein LTR85_011376 [Meristemomyces frigidus]
MASPASTASYTLLELTGILDTYATNPTEPYPDPDPDPDPKSKPKPARPPRPIDTVSSLLAALPPVKQVEALASAVRQVTRLQQEILLLTNGDHTAIPEEGWQAYSGPCLHSTDTWQFLNSRDEGLPDPNGALRGEKFAEAVMALKALGGKKRTLTAAVAGGG